MAVALLALLVAIGYGAARLGRAQRIAIVGDSNGKHFAVSGNEMLGWGIRIREVVDVEHGVRCFEVEDGSGIGFSCLPAARDGGSP